MATENEIKGLRVGIIRGEYDCTNGGISSKGNNIIIVGEDVPKKHEVGHDKNGKLKVYLKIVKRELFGSTYLHAEPVGQETKGVGWMFGGHFVYTTGDGFRDINNYPIPIHDRSETVKEYATYD